MNWIIIKNFVLLLIFVIFLGGCSNLVEERVGSSLPQKQNIKGGVADPEQNNVKTVNNVQVLFSPINSQVALHEPVFINLVIQNNLEQSVGVDLGGDRKEGFLFAIVMPDGRELSLPQLRSNGISSNGDFSIEPKQIYTQNLLLNEWIDFASPGKYVLKAQLANPIKTGDEKIVATDSSFSIIINVGSKNLEHLKKVSAMLTQHIAESTNYQENAETALALSYMNDPIVVPYLQEVLNSGKRVEPIIINGLVRIGDRNSVQVLINIMNEKPKSELTLLARAALGRIEHHSLDLDVKRMIKQALHSE